MTVEDIIGSVFTAIMFGNLITAKLVGLSWLTWSETAVILAAYVILVRLIGRVNEALNKDKED